jgi:rhodanese-related sulfurtransferase
LVVRGADVTLAEDRKEGVMRSAYRRIWVPVFALALVLAGCGGGAMAVGGNVVVATAPAVADAGELVLPAQIDPARVVELYDSGEVVVIDVREAWEYEEGHIPGATLIPLNMLAARLDEVPREGPVVLVCRSDNRSGQAQRFLIQQGFDNVSNMTGGMLAWEAAGYETAR